MSDISLVLAQADISRSIAQSPELLIPIIAIGGGLLVGVIAIIFGAITGMAKNADREKSRREIAAYIAEGSMTPQDGVMLMNAAASKEA